MLVGTIYTPKKNEVPGQSGDSDTPRVERREWRYLRSTLRSKTFSHQPCSQVDQAKTHTNLKRFISKSSSLTFSRDYERVGECRLTLLDSKTQKLVPSSSTWFQNLRPTKTLPETFRTVQKSSESNTTTSTV